jgi:hypothetical protein
MKVIGTDDKTGVVIVQMSKDEWEILQRVNGIPHDRRSSFAGITISTDPIWHACNALYEMKSMRKDLGALQKKWDTLATHVDAVLEK